MSWYDELSWIRDYRFPLYTKDKSVIECLEEWMLNYNRNLQKYVKFLSQVDIEKIIWYTQNLRNAHNSYLQGEYAKAFELFNETMEDIKDNLPTVYVGRERDNSAEEIPYYRVCAGNGEFTYKQCLHIPYTKRQLVSTNRFSAPGMPCSYMASQKEIALFECGMPNVYQLAEYYAVEHTERLLRLDINPLTDTTVLLNLSYDGDAEDFVKKEATKLCYVLPLVASCSVVAQNKEKAFVEAYIIPQMLMAWIKTCTDYVGVRYNSDVDNILVRCKGGYNIAMPASNPNEEGYSIELIRIFGINKNNENKKVETVNTVKAFKEKNAEKIENLIQYCDDILYTEEHTKSQELCDICRKIHSVCYTFITLLNSYMKGSTNEKYAVVIALSRILDWSELALEKVEGLLAQMKSDGTPDKENVDTAEKIVCEFKQYVVEFAQDIFFDLSKGEIWEN